MGLHVFLFFTLKTRNSLIFPPFELLIYLTHSHWTVYQNFVHFFLRGSNFLIQNFYLLLYIFWWHRTRPGYQGLVALLSLRFRENFQFKWESGSFGLKRSSWKCCRYGREEQVVGNERRVRERGRDFSSIL